MDLHTHERTLPLPPPTEPATSLEVHINHARARILKVELAGLGQPFEVEETEAGANGFRLTWSTPESCSSAALVLHFVGEPPYLVRQRWGTGRDDAPLDAPDTHGGALHGRLSRFATMADSAPEKQRAVEALFAEFGPWRGRGHVVRGPRTERGFEVVDEWRPGIRPELLDPALGGRSDGSVGETSWHIPIAERLEEMGYRPDQIAAGHTTILDVLSKGLDEPRAKLGIGPVPDVAEGLWHQKPRLQASLIDRARIAMGGGPCGLPSSVSELRPAIAYFSAMQRDLDEWYFGPLTDARAQLAYRQAIAAFASGELRLMLQKEAWDGASNTEPDSAFFFFFAEFALAAGALGVEADHWKLALPGLLAAQRAYLHFYAPRGEGSHGERLFMNYGANNFKAGSGPPLAEVLDLAESFASKPSDELEQILTGHCEVAFSAELELGVCVQASSKSEADSGRA